MIGQFLVAFDVYHSLLSRSSPWLRLAAKFCKPRVTIIDLHFGALIDHDRIIILRNLSSIEHIPHMQSTETVEQ